MMEEINASWIATMFTADSEFHIWVNCAHFIAGNLDEKPHAILIK
jgi:hypothetical protein